MNTVSIWRKVLIPNQESLLLGCIDVAALWGVEGGATGSWARVGSEVVLKECQLSYIEVWSTSILSPYFTSPKLHSRITPSLSNHSPNDIEKKQYVRFPAVIITMNSIDIRSIVGAVEDKTHGVFLTFESQIRCVLFAGSHSHHNHTSQDLKKIL